LEQADEHDGSRDSLSIGEQDLHLGVNIPMIRLRHSSSSAQLISHARELSQEELMPRETNRASMEQELIEEDVLDLQDQVLERNYLRELWIAHEQSCALFRVHSTDTEQIHTT